MPLPFPCLELRAEQRALDRASGHREPAEVYREHAVDRGPSDENSRDAFLASISYVSKAIELSTQMKTRNEKNETPRQAAATLCGQLLDVSCFFVGDETP